MLCKQEIDRLDAARTDNNGHPAYKQRCPSCGWFIMEAPAATILKVAVDDGARTRKNIVDHFRDFIRREGAADEPAIITTDDAQAYCYPQAAIIANAVHDRLMNGPIRELQESVKDLDGKVDGLCETVDGLCEVSTKIEDMHRWQGDMNHNIGAIRDHLGI